jgi:hypothetical protein
MWATPSFDKSLGSNSFPQPERVVCTDQYSPPRGWRYCCPLLRARETKTAGWVFTRTGVLAAVVMGHFRGSAADGLQR